VLVNVVALDSIKAQLVVIRRVLYGLLITLVDPMEQQLKYGDLDEQYRDKIAVVQHFPAS
jgi:hypothetical protein